MSQIRDVMSRVVISIRPESTLLDAVKTLTKHHVSGVPVVTRAGELVGFISESSLMDVLFDTDARKAPVTEFMNREVYVVESNEPLATAAKMLAMYQIRRLPVVENGRFVGVVTRRDLLAYSLTNPEPLSDPLLDLIPALGDFT